MNGWKKFGYVDLKVEVGCQGFDTKVLDYSILEALNRVV